MWSTVNQHNTHALRVSLGLLGLCLLVGAALAGLEALQAVGRLTTVLGAPLLVPTEPQTWLDLLRLHRELADALPMLVVVAATLVLALLAAGVSVWRRARRLWASPGVAHSVVAARPNSDSPTGSDSPMGGDSPTGNDDVLGSLPSREQFLTHHATAVADAAQHNAQVVMLCFDLERLSTLNAVLGFEAGDEAIAHTARRARASLGAAAVPARLGGGTFAALVRLEGTGNALQRAHALRQALQQSLPWRDQLLELGVTVGCAASPEHGETTADLLRRAEQALFEAKRIGAVALAYHPAIEAARLHHLQLASGLHQALENNEVVAFLQPRWCVKTRQLVGAEVLARWLHPTRGCLLPAEFLPFAESNGQMARITQHMLQTAVKMLRHELPGQRLSVNLCAADLREPTLVPLLQQQLQLQGVAAERLTLEVSEKALLSTGAEGPVRLAELRQLGVGVAIDDFGTGPSPLSKLRQWPASELKLDRSYVVDVDSNPGRQQLLQSIIDMAHNLNLTITAKGVETAGERDVLDMLGCDVLQGHLIGRALPAAHFAALVMPLAQQQHQQQQQFQAATAPATAH